VIVISSAIALPAIIGSSAATAAVNRDGSARRPSILLIVTDDQRWDTLWAMPHVRELLAKRGTTFSDAFVVNPLCCPSRSSILTGNYSHTTGVYRETPPFGAFQSFHDGSTSATWLHDQGYTTGLFGKYIDAYQHAALTGYVPPGWDRWAAFVRSRYLDYKLTIDGHIQAYGDDASDYSTNVLGSLAERFIRDTPGPIFVEYAPAAPHAPAIPEARFQGAFAHLPPWRPPSYDEPDVSDKPTYIRDLPPLSSGVRASVDGFRQNQYRTLKSVDAQVEALVGALRDTGRLSDTLIVFTSDNGISWGSTAG
jgi:arylsulfatase A-like enzyme